MKRTHAPDRNLTTVEADRDMVRIIRAYAKKNHLKAYAVTSELIAIGLRMKRLLPSQGVAKNGDI
jgi:hypothetical protein